MAPTTMHELFLCTAIENEDVARALQILQGYCAMKPVPLFRRRLFFEGPKTRNVKFLASKRDEASRKHEEALRRDEVLMGDEASKREAARWNSWRTFYEHLVRQSYVVTLIYEIDREEFGRDDDSEKIESQETDGLAFPCDAQSGSLLWADFPDPVGPRPVNIRSVVKIAGEKGLCSQMTAMGYRFTREVIQETHQYVHKNVVLDLTRYLELPNSPTGTQNQSPPKPRKQLPPYHALKPFDGENKWILTARVDVVIAGDQEPMKLGVAELATVKAEFEGCYDFRLVDRHVLDTRLKG